MTVLATYVVVVSLATLISIDTIVANISGCCGYVSVPFHSVVFPHLNYNHYKIGQYKRQT